MKIRKAELGDLDEIVRIEGLCFPEETAFPRGMFIYLIRYSVSLVACASDESIAGFVIGYSSGNVGAVYTLDVHPNYRRKGIGKDLVLALEKRLYAMGSRLIHLEADLENPESLGLYRKIGYQEKEKIKNYYGRGKHAVRMWKSLN